MSLADPNARGRHLLIVDDDDRIRELLKEYLARAGFRVTSASGGAAARKLIESLSFDLAVLDVMMPGEDGFSLTRWLREQRGPAGRTPILMLTARGDSSDRIEGLKLGADDYLAKPFEPYELVLRLRAMLRRRAAPPPIEPQGPIRLGRLEFDPARAELSGPDGIVHLTGGEAALLQVLAKKPGEVLSRDEIVDTLHMDEAGERAIDVQVTRLRRKIEADPREPRFLHTVRGRGYVLKPGT